MKVPLYDGATWREIEHPWPRADGEDWSDRLKRFGLRATWAFGDGADLGECIRHYRAADGRYLMVVDAHGDFDEIVAAHVGAALDLTGRWSTAFRAQEREALHALSVVALRAFEAWHGHPLNPEDMATGCRGCNREWEDVRAERRQQLAEARSLYQKGGA